MTIADANAFIAAHHRHNKPVRGMKFAIGATHEGRLVGVAIVGRPVARALHDGVTMEVTRVCVLADAPKGAPSFLYARCWRVWAAMGGALLVTYTLDVESGASLRGAGWRVVAKTRARGPSSDWTNRAGRERQSVVAHPKLRWAHPCQ